MTDDIDTPSPTQQEWQRIAARVRCELTALIPAMSQMGPESLTAFMKALDDSYWLEYRAAAHDKRIEIELNRSTFD